MQRVGLYVPGGKASYPSSVLMNTIPAKVAGVADVVMVAPTPSGQVNPLCLRRHHCWRRSGGDCRWSAGGRGLGLRHGIISAVDKIVGRVIVTLRKLSDRSSVR